MNKTETDAIANRYYGEFWQGLAEAKKAHSEAEVKIARMDVIIGRHVTYLTTLERVARTAKGSAAPAFRISDLLSDEEGDYHDRVVGNLRSMPDPFRRFVKETMIAIRRLDRLNDAYHRLAGDRERAAGTARALTYAIDLFEEWGDPVGNAQHIAEEHCTA